MTEDENRIIIDVRKLFPDVVRRLETLEKLQTIWPAIVGPAARHSKPYDLILSDLYVSADNNQTAQMIQNMKGNITRAFVTRFDYDEDAKINVIIKLGQPKLKHAPVRERKKTTSQAVTIDDEKVKQYISECPEYLPDDAKFAVSHLRAYLDVIGA